MVRMEKKTVMIHNVFIDFQKKGRMPRTNSLLHSSLVEKFTAWKNYIPEGKENMPWNMYFNPVVPIPCSLFFFRFYLENNYKCEKFLFTILQNIFCRKREKPKTQASKSNSMNSGIRKRGVIACILFLLSIKTI